jgi:hypothetical protein
MSAGRKASDFCRCAEALIATHGENAAYCARRCAIHLLSQSGWDGYDIWMKVTNTIREMEIRKHATAWVAMCANGRASDACCMIDRCIAAKLCLVTAHCPLPLGDVRARGGLWQRLHHDLCALPDFHDLRLSVQAAKTDLRLSTTSARVYGNPRRFPEGSEGDNPGF